MQIKARLYPYPIIDKSEKYASISGDYKTTTFDTEVTKEDTSNDVILSFNAIVKNNDYINELINKKILSYAFHVECPKTSFRKLYIFNENSFEEIIDAKQLNGKVEVCPFIIANQDIDNFQNLDWHDDYQGISFNIPKGSIVGIGREYDLNIIKEKDELKDLPSIFSVSFNDNDEMTINLEHNIITIFLPKKVFDYYKNIHNIDYYTKIIHATIVVPTLIYALERIIEKGDDAITEYGERGWFRTIKKAMEKRGVDFNDLKNINSFEWANELTEHALYSTLESLDKEKNQGGLEE